MQRGPVGRPIYMDGSISPSWSTFPFFVSLHGSPCRSFLNNWFLIYYFHNAVMRLAANTQVLMHTPKCIPTVESHSGRFSFSAQGECIVGQKARLNFLIPVDALKFWLTHNRWTVINNAPKIIFSHFHLACVLSPDIECDLPWSWRKWDQWVQVYHLLPSEAAALVWDNKGMPLCSFIEFTSCCPYRSFLK